MITMITLPLLFRDGQYFNILYSKIQNSFDNNMDNSSENNTVYFDHKI